MIIIIFLTLVFEAQIFTFFLLVHKNLNFVVICHSSEMQLNTVKSDAFKEQKINKSSTVVSTVAIF